MKSIVVNGKTIEEAINQGLSELGCAISDCKVDILQEGAKGLFGFFGSKQASVRLTLLAADPEEDLGIDFSNSLTDSGKPQREENAPRKSEKRESRPSEPAAVKHEEPAAEAQPAAVPAETVESVTDETAEEAAAEQAVPADDPKAARRNEVYERFHSAPMPDLYGEERAPRHAGGRSRKNAKAPKAAEETEERVETVSVPVPENIVSHDPQTVEGCAQQYLLEVTRRMDLEIQVDVSRGEDGHLFATMYGDSHGILIGRRGETLDALQYLTSLQVNKNQEEYIRVTLDTENYRAKREETLKRLANRMANRAVKSGRKVALEAMNPYERRILHAALQNNANVTTHSEGDEPYRHVVIIPKTGKGAQRAYEEEADEA